MRVGLFTACYKPTINGVVYHLEELKIELEKMGHQVFLFAPETKDYQDKEKNIIRYPSFPNPKVKSYPLGLPFLIRRKKIERLNLDVFHAHHPFPVGDFAAAMAKKLKKPLLFTHHTQYTLYLQYYLSPYLEGAAPKIISLWMEPFINKCDTVVCPTQAIAKHVNHSFPQAKTTVIPNGINTASFTPSKRRKKKQIIYVGRIDKEKSIGQLIRVFQKITKALPEYELLIVGGGNYLEKAKGLVRNFDLGRKVCLTGPKRREDLPKLLGESRLFVSLSKTEVMPLAVLEAAACGTPIAVPSLPNFQEVFLEGKGGVLLEKPKDFALIIIELLKNPKKLKRLSLEARKVSLRFSSRKTTRQVVGLYQTLLAKLSD